MGFNRKTDATRCYYYLQTDKKGTDQCDTRKLVIPYSGNTNSKALRFLLYEDEFHWVFLFLFSEFSYEKRARSDTERDKNGNPMCSFIYFELHLVKCFCSQVCARGCVCMCSCRRVDVYGRGHEEGWMWSVSFFCRSLNSLLRTIIASMVPNKRPYPYYI